MMAKCNPDTDSNANISTTLPLNQERRLRLYLVRHGESQANEEGVFAGQIDSPLTERGVIDAKSLGKISKFLMFQSLEQSQAQKEDRNKRKRHSCDFDGMYSSDLIRAHDTCKLILEGLRIRKQSNINNLAREGHDRTSVDIESLSQDIHLDQRLRERSYGTLQGMPWSSDRKDTDKIWRDTHGIDELPPMFESDDDIWNRVKTFLFELIEDEQMKGNDLTKIATTRNEVPTKHILITSHGGVLRQILMRLVGIDKLKKMGASFDTKRKNRLITPNASLSILDLLVGQAGENEDEGNCLSHDNDPGEDRNNNYFKGIKVDLIIFANTDHLYEGVRIHDD